MKAERRAATIIGVACQINRVILGTALDDKGDPFLATFDRKGNATTIFGKYET